MFFLIPEHVEVLFKAILTCPCAVIRMLRAVEAIAVSVDGIQFDIDLGFFMLNQMFLMNRALNAVACVFIFDFGTLMGFSHLKLSFLTLGYIFFRVSHRSYFTLG